MFYSLLGKNSQNTGFCALWSRTRLDGIRGIVAKGMNRVSVEFTRTQPSKTVSSKRHLFKTCISYLFCLFFQMNVFFPYYLLPLTSSDFWVVRWDMAVLDLRNGFEQFKQTPTITRTIRRERYTFYLFGHFSVLDPLIMNIWIVCQLDQKWPLK